ncbi:MAG TPA: SDR family NAD(P)-dependent oxidoreductase [Fimbriimonadaceae bacterium]|nr:SDR family NAD(P)-dependent oxidoreductase [Fimbriimonadaceae bacterium]
MRVLIAGASSGVGLAIAKAIESHSKHLVLMARRLDRLEKVADGLNATSMAGDVSNYENCSQAVDLLRGSGPLVVINSAGVADFGSFHESSAEDWSRQIDTNLLGTLNLCRAAVPHMLEAGQGRIINILSIAAVTAFPGAAAYCASKAGALALGRSLNAEYRTQGIHVVSVVLGSVDTPLWDGKAFVPEKSDMLTPEAVAEEVVHLAQMPFDRAIDEITLMPPKGIL